MSRDTDSAYTIACPHPKGMHFFLSRFVAYSGNVDLMLVVSRWDTQVLGLALFFKPGFKNG